MMTMKSAAPKPDAKRFLTGLLDVAKLRAELQVCCAELLASEEEYPKLEVDPELIPEIHLDPAPGEKPNDN